MRKHIPNILTLCNLCSGCLAVLSAFYDDYSYALIFVLVSAVFDFMDGFAARLLKVYSPLGKELDSLADVISFGFAPAMVAVNLLEGLGGYWRFLGLLIAAFSALRLAKFNIDDRQTSSFIGLPTPANAIFWVGLGFAYYRFFYYNYWYTLILVATTCYLLVAELPMFSLKFKTYSLDENIWRYLLIAISVILLVLFRLEAMSWIIVAYIVLSLLKLLVERKRQ